MWQYETVTNMRNLHDKNVEIDVQKWMRKNCKIKCNYLQNNDYKR